MPAPCTLTMTPKSPPTAHPHTCSTCPPQVFSSLSREPLASASLGQVYKGRLRPELGGAEVAVKVQRPNVFEGAALDIFVMRRAALIFSKLPMVSLAGAVLRCCQC